MKAIRNMAFTAFLTIGAFSLITYTSCNKDECKDVVCQNGGTCVAGDCQCTNGFEGELCETKVNAKFIGTWTASETCGQTDSAPYIVGITADPNDPTKVLISNLGDYGCLVGGTSTSILFEGVIDGNKLTIIDNKCNTKMTANGTYSNGTISIQYLAEYTTGSDNCSVTLTKE